MTKITTHLKQNPHRVSKIEIIAIALMMGLMFGLLIPAIQSLMTQPMEHWRFVWHTSNTPQFWVFLVALLASYAALRHRVNRWSSQMLECQVHFSLNHQIELDQALNSQHENHDPKTIHGLLKRHQHLIEVHGLIRFLLDVLMIFVTPLVLITHSPLTQYFWLSIVAVFLTAVLGMGLLYLIYQLRLGLDNETKTFLNSQLNH